ncbi:hypothetical protein [Paenibacillus sp. N3.4]|uniref:hypothetical protein n=1 Tax=Paenibacillus sp. N3.4 TaxID=2603222 RepID=UPI0011C96ABA|nr:hypothetical protein [Paenibacillus sp. N3.4]TXK77117.1 hypothetical protein FU659_23605 [Paenibacillus sp. N3.4]
MPLAQLDQLLKPVRIRLWKQTGLRTFIWSMTLGLATACVWLLLGRFFLISGYRYAAIVSLTGVLLVGVVWFFIRRPKLVDAALLLDRHGLDDRMTTALAYIDQTSLMAVLQRQEALEKGNGFVKERLYIVLAWKVSWKRWLPGVCALVVFASLLLLPNPKDADMLQASQDKAWVEEQKKKVEELKKEIEAKPSQLPAIKQMAADLNELANRLGQTPTTAEALKELEKTLKKMELGLGELAKQEQRSAQWAESMQRTEALRELAKALQQKSADNIQGEAAKLGAEVQKMSQQQKEKLASELERLAASAAAVSPEAEQQLREQLQQAASSLRSGDDAAALAQLQAGLAAASADQQALAQQQAQAAAAAASLAAGALPQARQLAASGASLGQAWAPGGRAEQLAAAGDPAAPSGGTPPSSAGASPGQSGTTANASPGQGGSAAGAGAGSGTGTGQGGSGAGGTQGGTGAGSRGLVATPRERAGTGGTYVDGGPTNGSGGEVSQSGSAPALDGASRPYEDVYADYAAAASKALNRSELPANMQNLVRDYFLEIQPQR